MKIDQELSRIIKEQSFEKIKQFNRIFNDFDSFHKFFHNDTKTAAKWIYNNDLINLFFSSFNNNTYKHHILSDLLYLILSLKTKTIQLESFMVGAISSEYFIRNYFPDSFEKEDGIIKIHKKLGVFKRIVSERIWEYTDVEPFYAYYLGKTNKLYQDKIIKHFLRNDDVLREIFHRDEQKYFQFLDSKGWIDLAIANDEISGEMEFVIENNLFKNKDPRFYQIVAKLLSDIVQEGDQYYLDFGDKEELASLFSNEEEVKHILSGDYFEFFSDSVSDFQNDCVDTLNDKGKKTVVTSILETMEGEEADYTMDGEEDYMKVTKENIDILIKNNSDFAEFLECDHLSDIKRAMEFCYQDAYNSAYESECYDIIMEKIKDFFGDSGKYHYLPKRRKQNALGQWTEYTPELYRINITTALPQIMKNFMKDYGNPLSYYGSLMSVLQDIYTLSVYFPDYVWNSKELIDIYNETISDCLRDRI